MSAQRQAAHLRPEACYVCGHGPHENSTERGGHAYWSNKEAREAFAAEQAANMPGAEARYVEQHRPY